MCIRGVGVALILARSLEPLVARKSKTYMSTRAGKCGKAATKKHAKVMSCDQKLYDVEDDEQGHRDNERADELDHFSCREYQ